MKAIRQDLPLSQLEELNDEVELAILFDWLEMERPEALRAVDILAASDASLNTTPGPIRLTCKPHGGYGEHALSNAVARLVLSGVQHRLPQWAAVSADGEVALARSYTLPRVAKVQALPRLLFEINWADSSPGFSWHEAYHLAYLPGFDEYVVTASQDSPDVHGYTDEAIGHFPAHEALERGTHRVIVGWWRAQAEGWDQERWVCLFRTGDVDLLTASFWADEVWPPPPEEPEEEEEE
jgi:hypothetical protein